MKLVRLKAQIGNRSTEKAYQVLRKGQFGVYKKVFLPISQVTLEEDHGGYIYTMRMPEWLAKKRDILEYTEPCGIELTVKYKVD